MSETRFTSGMLVFPDLIQFDLIGPYEVLARLPGAPARAKRRQRDRAACVVGAATALR